MGWDMDQRKSEEQPKMLFVDDEESILYSIERLFIDTEASILKAANAEEALELFKDKSYP